MDYNTQTMLGYIRQTPRATNFLTDMFVKDRPVHNTTALILDQVFGNQEIAVYTNRYGGPHQVGKNGYSTLTHVAPYVYEQVEFNPEDSDTREPGTTEYESVDSIDYMVSSALDELDVRIGRREEQQLAEALQTGTIAITDQEGKSYTADFKQNANHLVELTSTARWTETDTCDIRGNIRDWVQLPILLGAPRPNVIIADVYASTLIKDDSNFTAQLDNRRIENGFLSPEILDRYNATFEGVIKGTGFNLQLYTYQGTYSSSGTSYNFMNDYTVILGNTNAPVTIEYGKISNLKAPGFKGMRFPNRWMEPDGKHEYITLEASPLVNLRQPNCFVAAHVTNDA